MTRIDRMTVRLPAGTDPAVGRAAAAEVAQALRDRQGRVDSVSVSVASRDSIGAAVAEAVHRHQSGEETRR